MGANVAPSAGPRCGALHAAVGTSGAVSKQLSVAGPIYCGGKYRCLCFGEGFLLLKVAFGDLWLCCWIGAAFAHKNLCSF